MIFFRPLFASLSAFYARPASVAASCTLECELLATSNIDTHRSIARVAGGLVHDRCQELHPLVSFFIIPQDIQWLTTYLSLVPRSRTRSQHVLPYRTRSKMIQHRMVRIIQHTAIVFHRCLAVQDTLRQEHRQRRRRRCSVDCCTRSLESCAVFPRVKI